MIAGPTEHGGCVTRHAADSPTAFADKPGRCVGGAADGNIPDFSGTRKQWTAKKKNGVKIHTIYFSACYEIRHGNVK